MVGITTYNVDPNLNTTVQGVFIGENCPAGNLNDAERALMSDLALWLASPTFTGPIAAPTPNSGTSGGVRITGNATSGNAILQFTDSAGTVQWAYLLATAAGGVSVTDSAGTPRNIGFLDMPLTAGTAGRAIALADRGFAIPTTGNMSIPTNATTAFPVGSTIGIYNNSGSNISITASGGVTLRLGGSATTGTRTLAQRGYVTLWKVATDEWVALNGGLS